MLQDKVCRKCKKSKPLSGFYSRPVSKSYPDGLRSRCKECENADGRKWAKENKDKNARQSSNWRKNNPEKHKEIEKKYRSSHKEQISKRRKEWGENNAEYFSDYLKSWRENNKEKQRVYHLKRYNPTPAGYDNIATQQEWKCAICTIDSSMTKRGLFVDHCHSTSEVRGLLCGNCNLMIGYAKDNQEVLMAAINYLNRKTA